jgi:RNA polymerase sigma-70 factor (ECF subfamily)
VTVQPIDERVLADGVRREDPETLGKVVEWYLPQILRAARAAGLDPHRAEEVSQATFTTFIEKASTFEGRSKVRTWLFGILYNKIAETRRQLARDYRQDEIDELIELKFDSKGRWSSPPRQVDREVYSREVRRFIEDCLDQVPEKQRMAFVLREIEGLSTEEICKILDVTPTNSGVLLFRVRNRLRECLEAKGIQNSG